MSLRIGLVVYGLDRPPTGIARYTHELARGLACLPAPPDIVLLVAGGLGPLAGQTPFAQVGLPGCRLLPGLLTAGHAVIARAARRLRLDVVHDPTGVAPFLANRKRFRTVLTLHDVFPWSFPGYSTRLDTIIYRHWLPRMAPRVDAIVTDSLHSKQDIQSFLHVPANRIAPIYPGVSPAFKPAPSGEVEAFLGARFGLVSPYLLYAGMLTPRKNIGRILQAFGRVHADFPGLRLVLAGPRSGRSLPPETLDGLAPAGAVHFTGVVGDEELAMLYRGASLFLFPSLYEGFGQPILEAMACGAPVLTSDRSSLPEVAGDAALLVDPLDVAGIASSIRRVLYEPGLDEQLRQRGEAQAARFSWQRTAEEVLAVYERTLDGG